jgi:GAF domain-containing protein
VSTTPDSALADPQQIIADLQRELAERTAERDEASRRLDERTAERDEALQREIAAAEVLQVINSSPGDLAPVFETMLERAIRLCDAIQGVLWIIEGERGRIAASQGLPAGFIELLRESGRTGSNPMLQRVIRGENLLHFVDTAKHELYRAGNPLAKAAVDANVRTLVCVALLKDNLAVGAFAIGRREVRPFSDKQIALLRNFAAQAVIAMENARLLTETREALEQQTATAEVLGVINASPGDLAPVFDAILEKAHTLCGAPLGALLTFDGESFGFLARKVPAALVEITDRPFKPGPQNRLNDLIRGESLLHIPDAREVLALAPEDPQLHATVEVAGMRTFLAVPLRKDDRLIGAITAARQEVRPFTEKQIALLQNFAAQAVIAMENARLITETREALEQQTATAEVLGVINASPGDLAPVFDAILEKAHTKPSRRATKSTCGRKLC